jgi:two-component system response regulator BaeR
VTPTPVSNDEAELRYRDVCLQLERFTCEVLGRRLELTPVEFRILKVLLARPGRVLSRDQLMQASYDDHRIVSDRTIDSHINNLRRKIGEVTGDTTLIHSIYGVANKIE